MPTVSDAVADVIAEHSEVVFGLMGNGNAWVVGNLTARGVRYVGAKHEAGTVAMADAYYRATGRMATATVTYGAGFTNALTALAEARMARIPLVLVAGDAPSTGLRPWDIEQETAARALDVLTLTVDAASADVLAARAFDLAEQERTPVVLAIPHDLAGAELEGQVALQPLAEPVPAAPAAQAVARAAAALQAAQRPLIVAGRGAVLAGAGPALRAAGDRIGALFATSAMARNLFGSPWDLGVAGGFGRLGPVQLMRQADVVLFAGCSLNMFQTRYGTLTAGAHTVIQVDELPAPTHEAVTDFIQADAGRFAEALLGALAPAGGPTWRDAVPQVAGGSLLAEPEVPETGPDGRLDPRPFARALDAVLPQDRTVVQDGGHFSGWMPMYARIPDPQALLLVGTAFQTIGLGFAAAAGAAVGRPERTTVLVTGDGGGLMALADLPTLVQHAASAVVVVFNDAAYGAELHQYAVRGVDPAAMYIEEVDFAALGRALGAEGVKARSLADLDALRAWVDAGARGTFVLDLPVSREVVAEYMQESMSAVPRK
ncbi:thiamine pyrophosphate-binding protein [Arthrobacter mobilis]|uniref:Thiamine pyrophosphate-binding protein n=1 Tax=Arthrobacter mobilis TaxID=2724944 RepID=A0A7X6K4R6_9MICC|nr:thiamine pyrophosphate-binding protein [Arthrobacter mobilis]NKX53000.1 thiamine pyrophosphate-binding protein [Arthrobacter mobilis]